MGLGGGLHATAVVAAARAPSGRPLPPPPTPAVAAPALPSAPTLIPNLCRTSVVGSVTWGSAMPGLSLAASAAGAALLNMPMQPWVTLDIAGLLPETGAERVGGLCSWHFEAE
jgi:hypothetical protein